MMNTINTDVMQSAANTLKHANVQYLTVGEMNELSDEQIAQFNKALNELQNAADKLDILANYARAMFQIELENAARKV